MFNYNEVYYRINNYKECHSGFTTDILDNGYQYYDGLNKKEPFNEDPNEYGGDKLGLFFTNQSGIKFCISYGCFIREITIPNGAKVIKSGGCCWRCDKMILGKKTLLYSDESFQKFKIDIDNIDWRNIKIKTNNFEFIQHNFLTKYKNEIENETHPVELVEDEDDIYYSSSE